MAPWHTGSAAGSSVGGAGAGAASSSPQLAVADEPTAPCEPSIVVLVPGTPVAAFHPEAFTQGQRVAVLEASSSVHAVASFARAAAAEFSAVFFRPVPLSLWAARLGGGDGISLAPSVPCVVLVDMPAGPGTPFTAVTPGTGGQRGTGVIDVNFTVADPTQTQARLQLVTNRTILSCNWHLTSPLPGPPLLLVVAASQLASGPAPASNASAVTVQLPRGEFQGSSVSFGCRFAALPRAA